MSLAWTQKVKCEMKESSLYEQFTIYFFNMFVAREGRERVGGGTSQQYNHGCLSVEGGKGWWYIPTVHPSMPITGRSYKQHKNTNIILLLII